ncbi:MAG: hypothetical protein A2452_01375 [Candidatus Firestonebacteria bacterium RIFOXYC2_FULL_39_67]|nr:MAG: hypothetical protein A2536_03005 [Candidatus Firestonebacteria bacterium RIFOXYD2_FULL_39_29]OGF53602.1 MAG: hypothetical protein A2452_01375 [Candidatus Firestonebacteria bacterium RIFOXYC2_FULL_39_67]
MFVRKIRKYTNRKYTSKDKIRIVLEEFRKEISVANLCRRENVHVAIYSRNKHSGFFDNPTIKHIIQPGNT